MPFLWDCVIPDEAVRGDVYNRAPNCTQWGWAIRPGAVDDVRKAIETHIGNIDSTIGLYRGHIRRTERLKVKWDMEIAARGGRPLTFHDQITLGFYGDPGEDIKTYESAIEAQEESRRNLTEFLAGGLEQYVMPHPQRMPGDDCSCKACKARDDYRNLKSLKRKEVRYHGYDPGYRCRKTRAEDRPPYFLGVELETDRHAYVNGSRIESDLDDETVTALAKPEDFWEGTHDSSISGIEFVSHPATLLYWRSIRPHLADMFKTLIHAGYRSHDNDQCGMHVSISKSAFADEYGAYNVPHLARFIRLINFDPDWSISMSQRTEDSATEWAALDLSTWVQCRTRAEEYANEEIPDSRYVALNNPGDARFEFRLPRGTLRLDRFYKNIEWTESMIQYTKEIDSSNAARPSFYGQWLVSRKGRKYPNLLSFMRERNLLEVA